MTTISGIRPRLGARSSWLTVAPMSIFWFGAHWTVPSIHGPARSHQVVGTEDRLQSDDRLQRLLVDDGGSGQRVGEVPDGGVSKGCVVPLGPKARDARRLADVDATSVTSVQRSW